MESSCQGPIMAGVQPSSGRSAQQHSSASVGSVEPTSGSQVLHVFTPNSGPALIPSHPCALQAERQQRDDAYIDKLKRKQAPQRAPKAASQPRPSAVATAEPVPAAAPIRAMPQIPTGPLVRMAWRT